MSPEPAPSVVSRDGDTDPARARLVKLIQRELDECDEIGASEFDTATFIVDRLESSRDLVIDFLGELDAADFAATVRDAWSNR